ncbi:hypothetical protein PRIPAC_88378 [Pristionchus pacificus]|uniref:Uncharacterized protein n=1 Tax=Pristionchus pacificus TaxID=54126 RepID=A0A2A6B8R0_PRIPA|nr:hypothetical protein PRIPAC_88378 [Pristionchus pacificus]|eukprot:PDM62266.1 hypothetical protein PRIPAC_51708 [Pristionchus pacificus]
MATVSEYAGRLPSPLLRISIDHLDKHDVIILIFLIVDDDWFDVLVVVREKGQTSASVLLINTLHALSHEVIDVKFCSYLSSVLSDRLEHTILAGGTQTPSLGDVSKDDQWLLTASLKIKKLFVMLAKSLEDSQKNVVLDAIFTIIENSATAYTSINPARMKEIISLVAKTNAMESDVRMPVLVTVIKGNGISVFLECMRARSDLGVILLNRLFAIVVDTGAFDYFKDIQRGDTPSVRQFCGMKAVENCCWTLKLVGSDPRVMENLQIATRDQRTYKKDIAIVLSKVEDFVVKREKKYN